MTKQHQNWEKFCELLEGPEGCNFKKDKKGKTTWNCDAKTKSHAERILRKYFPKIDIKETFEYFDNNGGYCDCEILFNVA